MNGRNRQLLIIGGLILAVIVLGIIGSRRNKVATGGEGVPAGSSAFLVYEGASYLPFNVDANNLMKEDVAYFARSKVKPYNSGKQIEIIFKISKQPITKGFVTTFSGKFEKSKDTINVSITLLKNSRIKTSISDTSSKVTSDGSLPSNNARNQFIGTLPVTTAEYNIDYSSYTDVFLITLYTSSAQDSALKALKSGLRVTNLDNKSYSFINSSNDRGGAPLPE